MLSRELKKELKRIKRKRLLFIENDYYKRILRTGNIDYPINWHNENLLQLASEENMIDLVKLLLENGADPNFSNLRRPTPLIIAARKGYTEIVNLLLTHKADVNLRFYASFGVNYNALEEAFHSRTLSTQIIKSLIDAGADVSKIKKDSNNYFILALQEKNIELIKLLLENGANINSVSNDGTSILNFMITSDIDNLEIYDYILKNGMDPNIKDKDGKTAIMYAAEKGKLDILKRLIDTVARTNICDNEKKGILCHAMINNHYDIVKYLIENKIELCMEDKEKTLILTDNIKLAKFLLENGVNINAQDSNLRTSLFNAIERNDINFVKFLLEYTETNSYIEGPNPYGANPNIKDINGQTPLMLAIIKGHKEIYKMLLEYGADVNIKDKKGYTVQDYGHMYNRYTEDMKTEIELAAQTLKMHYDLKKKIK